MIAKSISPSQVKETVFDWKMEVFPLRYVWKQCTNKKIINCSKKFYLLLTFALSLTPDHAWQNVRPDLDPNCLSLWWYSWKNFLKKFRKKISRWKKSMQPLVFLFLIKNIIIYYYVGDNLSIKPLGLQHYVLVEKWVVETKKDRKQSVSFVWNGVKKFQWSTIFFRLPRFPFV